MMTINKGCEYCIFADTEYCDNKKKGGGLNAI